MSKPCLHCIRLLSTLPEKKGYKIENILYSDEKGCIIKTNITNLVNSNDNYISSYYRNTNYNKKRF